MAKGQSIRVLVVDDEPEARELFARMLADCELVIAKDGAQALQHLREQEFDVVVSDVDMPGLDGIALLRAAGELNPDLPVILITGNPQTKVAVQAVRYRATAYLPKPVEPQTVIREVERAHRLHGLARLRRSALRLSGHAELVDQAPVLAERFESALDKLYMAYQPIVCWSQRRVYAYEALVRTTEPTVPHPGVLLQLAEGLGGLEELGRRIRRVVTDPMQDAPDDVLLFVNLHPQDLADETLFDPDSSLVRMAQRVVLEVTERADLEQIGDVEQRIERLRKLGFRIAIDDIGAGYAGLTSFVTLQPEIVKLDMALIRDIEGNVLRQKLVSSLLELCRGLDIGVVAEGVETLAERDTLIELGCDLFQGYLFARPAPPFVKPTFD